MRPIETGRRVLVVCDNPDGPEGLRELLTIWGYEVEVAHNGAQMLGRPRGRRPEAVVMDLGLREGDALDVIQRIKTEDERTVVVAFSNWDDFEGAARAAGADLFVPKTDLQALKRLMGCLEVRPSEPAAVTRITQSR
jgi:CheY-like chemotaxis protein